MSLIERVLDNISNKHEETTAKLSLDFREFLGGNGKDFTIKLVEKFANHLEQSLNYHSNKIKQFVFVQNANYENSLLQPTQTNSDESLAQNKQKLIKEKQQNVQQTERLIKQKRKEQISTSKDQLKKRKKLVENDSDIYENPEPKTDYNKKKHKETQFLQQSNPSQKKSKLKTIENKKHKNFHIKKKDRTQSLQQKQININGPIHISDQINKGQSKKNLQEENPNIRNKSFKSKSRKLRTNLIKLTPIAQEKQKQMKRKQANQRIQAALEFLNNLPSRKKMNALHPTEWRQQKIDNNIINKNISSPMNLNYIKLKELTDKYRQQKSHQHEANLLQLSDVTRKRYKQQKMDRFSLQKPQAYNLYNINMSKNEIFQLKKI